MQGACCCCHFVQTHTWHARCCWYTLLDLAAASDKMLSDMWMACLNSSVMMGTTQPSMTGQQMLMDTVLMLVVVMMSVLFKHSCVLSCM